MYNFYISLRRNCGPRTLRGFTLLEFLITSLISAIALSIVSPSFYPLLQSYRVSSTINTVERSLRLARQVAVFKNKTVRLCPSAEGRYCDAFNNWSVGMLSYVDSNNDGIRQLTEEVVKRYSSSPKVEVSFNRLQQISFNGLGRASANGTFTVCDPKRKAKTQKITLIHSGRIRQSEAEPGCP